MNKLEYIKRAKKEQWNICIYGVGYLGKKLYREIPLLFNLVPNYYSDGDDIKVKETKLKNMQPIYKSNLLQIENFTIVFILVDNPYDIEIQNMLSVNPKLITFTLRELTHMEEVLKLFYGEEIFERYLRLDNYEMKEGYD